MKTGIATIVLLMSFSIHGKAQVAVEDSLHKARSFAYDGEYNKAEKLTKQVLTLYPDNNDAQFLLGLISAWDGKFEPGRSVFETLILKEEYFMGETYEALTRLEIWDHNPEKALAICNIGIEKFPNNINLQYLQAKALAELEKTEDAIDLLENLLDQNPDNEEAIALLEELQLASLKNSVAVSYANSQFSNTFTPWHQSSLTYQRNTNIGPLLTRLNYAYIFDRSTLQAEVDAYPRYNAKTYSYFNFGVSDGKIFPKVRFGAELYRSLPKGFEVSLGIRGLYFDPVNVYIYTAQAGKYYSNYWFSLRGFMSLLEGSNNFTGHFVGRRYFNNKDHYFSFYLTNGTIPLKIVSLSEIERLHSSAVGIDYQYPVLRNRLLLKLYAEYQYEQYREIRTTDRYTISLYIEKRF